MQYTNIGGCGLVVSRLAFGAMTFGQGTLIGGIKAPESNPSSNRKFYRNRQSKRG